MVVIRVLRHINDKRLKNNPGEAPKVNLCPSSIQALYCQNCYFSPHYHNLRVQNITKKSRTLYSQPTTNYNGKYSQPARPHMTFIIHRHHQIAATSPHFTPCYLIYLILVASLTPLTFAAPYLCREINVKPVYGCQHPATTDDRFVNLDCCLVLLTMHFRTLR